MSKLSVSRFFPVTLPLDGVEIRFRIKRLQAGEFFAFSHDFDIAADPPSERRLLLRAGDDELAKRPVTRPRTDVETRAVEALETLRECLKSSEHRFPVDDAATHSRDQVLLALLSEIDAAIAPEPTDEVFVIDDAEIRRRRLDEMAPPQRAAWDAQDAEDERFASSFIASTIRNYVEVEHGEIDVEGEPVITGDDLLRYFGGQAGALKALVRAVREENLLPTSLKNALRSVRDSKPSSSTPDREVPGPAPAPTAAPAA